MLAGYYWRVITCQMSQQVHPQSLISLNLVSKQNFSCWLQWTNSFENRLRFRKVMDDIRWVGVAINEAEWLWRKSSTNFKTKFLPEYSFNCWKNLKRCCRKYPDSTCVEIMQNNHGQWTYFPAYISIILPQDYFTVWVCTRPLIGWVFNFNNWKNEK